MNDYEHLMQEEATMDVPLLLNGTGHTPVAASASIEMPWEDFSDDGGYDDDESLIGKIPTLADRIKTAGFRELLGFQEGR